MFCHLNLRDEGVIVEAVVDRWSGALGGVIEERSRLGGLGAGGRRYNWELSPLINTHKSM